MLRHWSVQETESDVFVLVWLKFCSAASKKGKTKSAKAMLHPEETFAFDAQEVLAFDVKPT